MSDIDVHEIKLDLRYPNSRQEDITDAFMRGYQGAVKIGNDAVRRVKAEKEALERRIDELCEQLEYNRQTSRSRLERIDQLVDENAQLRELVHGFAIYRHFDCQHCGYREQCKAGQTNCYKAYVDLIKRARQMGIEVDA